MPVPVGNHRVCRAGAAAVWAAVALGEASVACAGAVGLGEDGTRVGVDRAGDDSVTRVDAAPGIRRWTGGAGAVALATARMPPTGPWPAATGEPAVAARAAAPSAPTPTRARMR